MNTSIKQILEGVKDGRLSVEEAALKLKLAPFEDIGYAKVDMHRALRQGVAEVIYGAGKTPEQIIGIADTLRKNNRNTILITRLDKDQAAELEQTCALTYHAGARIGIIGDLPRPDGIGKILEATAGTSDIPVAEEAALTA
ncbi:MAG: 1-(5-phosphoribosyl)-5-amino-4-imidazole-carboxylate carboxylase, partial [Synergistaceae bacterium]|nr:1-(5-phosphoribosyl)-5-amino-4-imidazole-carboxylate carboxylase [Synergistaceae bacterium]